MIDDQHANTGESPVYLSPDDPSLSLVPKTTFNKKTLHLAMVIIGFLGFVGLIRVFIPKEARVRAARGDNVAVENFELNLPPELQAKESDYAKGFQDPPGAAQDEPVAPEDAYVASERYASDDRRPQPQEQTIAVRTRTESPTVFGAPDPSYTSSEDPRQSAYASPIFFPVSSSTAFEDPAGAGPGTDPVVPDAGTETEYEHLNQHAEKVAWLESRRGDYSIYRDYLPTDPVVPGQELSAGTVIPIILITGINSDLPGEIKGQVLTDIYDSYTGSNLLIAGGSFAFGQYDSQVSFGQNRVLFAWDRITRTDGITITLGGMQGTDMAGMTGVRDKVDYHYDEVATGVAIGSVFDLAVGIASAGLNSLGFFDFGDGDAASIFNDNSTTAKNAVDTYVDNTFNRQPTLVVRPGFRTNMIVNKNLVLPLYQGG